MKLKLDDGKTYEIDMEKAKDLGLCKEVLTPITDLEAGDVFQSASSLPVLIIQTNYARYGEKETFNFAGLIGLKVYSSHRGYGLEKKEMLDYLNKGEYQFKKNINNEIHNLIN